MHRQNELEVLPICLEGSIHPVPLVHHTVVREHVDSPLTNLGALTWHQLVQTINGLFLPAEMPILDDGSVVQHLVKLRGSRLSAWRPPLATEKHMVQLEIEFGGQGVPSSITAEPMAKEPLFRHARHCPPPATFCLIASFFLPSFRVLECRARLWVPGPACAVPVSHSSLGCI